MFNISCFQTVEDGQDATHTRLAANGNKTRQTGVAAAGDGEMEFIQHQEHRPGAVEGAAARSAQAGSCGGGHEKTKRRRDQIRAGGIAAGSQR